METIARKEGLRFREKVYVNGRAINSPYFRRKVDAKEWKRNKLLERDRLNAQGLIIQNEITVRELSRRFLISKSDKSKRTIEAYKCTLDHHILPLFGEARLKHIRPFHGDELKQLLLKKGIGKIRINNILNFLKILFNYAVKQENLLVNPFKNLEFLKSPKRELSYWMPQEAERFLLANLHDPHFSIFLVALNTGMRKGELCGLCWDAVDFNQRRLIVKRTRDRHGLKETTKGKENRIIPMNNAVCSELSKLHAIRSSFSYVFTDCEGLPVGYEHLGDRVFKKAIVRAGVRKIRFHDLRTTYASTFCMNGGNIFTLSKLLGHKSVEVTQQSYAELSSDYLLKEAEKVDFRPSNSPHLALTSTQPEKT